MIAHPPCTYLCSSGLHWNKRTPGREEKTIEALAFVEKLWNAPIAKIAIENPIGRVSSLLGKATQIVQPYEFGHDASKATCLWLKGLPPIIPTQIIQPRLVCCGNVLDGEVEKYGCPNCNGGKKPLRRWGNQTNSGQNKLPPTEDRWKIRSQTYVGICIIPLGDSSEHYWRVCPCKPRFEREGDTVIEIHNAFDGRQSGTSAPKPN